MVWDRRALNRSVASPAYIEALDADHVPFGGALRLDRAMDMESNPESLSDRNSFIRRIAYCRDHRGMLAVLSRTGQLKVLTTQAEFIPVDLRSDDSPELLQVRKSHEMDNFYSDANRKSERIVSFDWLTMGSPAPLPRLLVLRANGAFEILEVPSFTRTYPFKLTPWKAPFRGIEEGSHYHSIMGFEPSQTLETLGPLFMENALSDVPVFGPDRADFDAIAQAALRSQPPEDDYLTDEEASVTPLSNRFYSAKTVSDKLKAIRAYSQDVLHPNNRKEDVYEKDFSGLVKSLTGVALGPATNLGLHESLLKSTMDTAGFPKPAQVVLDHVMLLRAKEKYLFDCKVNRVVIEDDPWLQDVWDWIAGQYGTQLFSLTYKLTAFRCRGSRCRWGDDVSSPGSELLGCLHNMDE